MDDVIGWMISVAKRRGIPVEDMNMHRFANCTGPLLTLMTQQNFIERDPNHGAVLYMEFRKLMGGKCYLVGANAWPWCTKNVFVLFQTMRAASWTIGFACTRTTLDKDHLVSVEHPRHHRLHCCQRWPLPQRRLLSLRRYTVVCPRTLWINPARQDKPKSTISSVVLHHSASANP